MTVGEKIRQRREYIGMSQDELAKRMGYKDRSSISKIEKESDRNMSLETVQKAADILNCSPLYLMGWESPKTKNDDLGINDNKENEFIALFDQLDEEQQKLVQNMMQAFLSKK